MMKSLSPLVALWLAVLAAPAAAQPTLTPGMRVRVLPGDSAASHAGDPARGWLIGSLVSGPRPALVLDMRGGRVSYAVGEIRQIDVSRGRPNNRWKGAIIGGLLSGAAFAGAACAFSDGSCDIGGNVGGFVAYFAVGAIPGAIVGGALGARRLGDERWQSAWPTP